MISRLVVAVVVGVIAGLICLLLGTVFNSLGIPPVEALGDFLRRWAWVIGLLVGLLSFFRGGPTITL